MVKRSILLILLFLLSCSLSAFASDQTTTQDRTNLNELAGMYWKNFTTGFVGSKEKIETTDVLEIVPYDAKSLYFRTRLNFSNGHSCSISGLAEKEDEKFVFYDTTSGKNCIMEVIPTADKIFLKDTTGDCRVLTCGARGEYSHAYFSRTKKKPIAYMNKLKSSPQYLDAVEKYKKRLDAENNGIDPRWANAKNMLVEYAVWGNREGVKQSLAQGADLSSVAKNGRSVLAAAAYSRDIVVTEMLLNHGLNINSVQSGETLLTAASHRDPGHIGEEDFNYITWLLEKGADANIKDSQGKKPLDIAIETEQSQKVIDLLKTHTSK